MGDHLGERQSTLLARRGEPDLDANSSMHGHFWAYSIEDGRVWLVYLVHDGRVEAISAIPKIGQLPKFNDSYGIALGDRADHVTSVRGKPDSIIANDPDPSVVERQMLLYDAGSEGRWLYGIQNGVVQRIGVTLGETHLVSIIRDYRRDGSNTLQAVQLSAFSIRDIQAKERRFFASRRCQGAGSWQVGARKYVTFRKKIFDEVIASCTVPTLQRPFYFEVSPFAVSHRG